MSFGVRAGLEPWRVWRWMPGRGAAICLLVAGSLVGAIVGALLRRPPAYPERAEALVVVADGPSALGGTRPERIRTLVAALTSQPVLTAVKLQAGTPGAGISASGSVNVESHPSAGTLTVVADADNGSVATTLANSASSYAVMLVGRVQAAANAPYSIPASDFSGGIGAWGGISQFALPPLSLRVAPTGGRYHDGSLSVVCPPKPGCGPSVSLELTTVPHRAYTGALWVRAVSHAVQIVPFLGSDPKDVATGQPVTLASTWRRVAVSWTPSHPHSRIELGVLLAAPRTARFVVDAASITYGPAPPSRAQERHLFAHAGAAVALPAQVTGVVPGKTALSAALGAVAGLLAAAVGCGAGAVARRRQSDAQQ
ncbi:MAG TPA: hypothetical protein VNX67_02735 [Solirubrobacteraceae bacterium]|nr:hypothetical protein [Solirubrobacteraceae bacterium]